MRFGFRSLIVATALFSVAIWAVCWFTADWRERQRVVADLRSLGASGVIFTNLDGSPTLEFETSEGWTSARVDRDWTFVSPRWFDRGEVTTIGFDGPIASEGLVRYPHVTSVFFHEGAEGVDKSLEYLRVLPKLESLNLTGTDVTDAGVARLVGLDSLEVLSLCETAVTDECLDEFAALPELKMVRLRNTQVTDAGVAWLREQRPGLGVWKR